MLMTFFAGSTFVSVPEKVLGLRRLAGHRHRNEEQHSNAGYTQSK